jgi:hypothetical protein
MLSGKAAWVIDDHRMIEGRPSWWADEVADFIDRNSWSKWTSALSLQILVQLVIYHGTDSRTLDFAALKGSAIQKAWHLKCTSVDTHQQFILAISNALIHQP